MDNKTKNVFDTLHSLRTIHGNFTEQAISENDLQSILEAAVRAANSSSRQAYSIISLSDKKTMIKICGFSAPRALLFLADQTRYQDIAETFGFPSYENSLDDLLTATIDASLAAQNAVIAAKTLGIDSLITNGVFRVDPKVFAELLNIPEKNCIPILVVLFGYPKSEPKHLHGRYLGAGLLHNEKYQRMNKEEMQTMSAKYDDPNLHLGLDTDWRASACQSYLEWFFKKWLAMFKSGKEQDNALLLAKKAGFIK